jgi:hypothetical protein
LIHRRKLLAAILFCTLATSGSISTVECQTHADAVSVVDRETLTGKLIVGYQGWFSCPKDSPGNSEWRHWFGQNHVTVDMLPDVSEFDRDELCATPWKNRDGQPIYLYSAQNPASVDRHFGWMQQYGIQTVALQRFAQELLSRSRKPQLDTVLHNVRNSAEAHGRSFYLEYDLTSVQDEQGVDAVVEDWYAQEKVGLPQSSAYQQHKKHPVLGIFGIGFHGRYMSAKLASELIAKLREASKPYGGITLIGGVPAGWRSLTTDPGTDVSWRTVYRTLDVISPWTVGHYRTEAEADAFRKDYIGPDIALTRQMNVEYMPVIFPGFSWHNLSEARGDGNKALNQIPRECGRFYWHQVRNVVDAGSTMAFNAMFDEVDEGTAMFKVVPSRSGLPIDPPFVSLDADGCKLPSDWYLRLAGAAGVAVKNQRAALLPDGATK